jgi:hypothetical protein
MINYRRTFIEGMFMKDKNTICLFCKGHPSFNYFKNSGDKNMKLSFQALFLAIVIVLSGCDDKIRDAKQLIQAAIDDIQNDSTKWRQAIVDVSANLPADTQDTIKHELSCLAERTISQAGVEFRVNVDFLAKRSTESLNRVLAMLDGISPPVLPPSLSHVSPAILDIAHEPSKTKDILVFGYDLDHKDANGKLISFFYVNSKNEVIAPLPDNLVNRTTHYQITLLFTNSIYTYIHENDIKKIIGFWNNEMITAACQIAVKHWEPNRRTISHHIPDHKYVPPHTQGDGDFNITKTYAMDVQCWAKTYLDEGDNCIYDCVYMFGGEPRSDWTNVKGTSKPRKVFSPDPGWKVVSFQPLGLSDLDVDIRDYGELHYTPSGSVAKRFRIWGDHKGNEAGTWTNVLVEYNEIQIILEEIRPF